MTAASPGEELAQLLRGTEVSETPSTEAQSGGAQPVANPKRVARLNLVEDKP
jgi:hypothetical protein